MVQRTVEDLVKNLQRRRTVGERPPVVLLGAGASVESGIGAMTELFAFLDCADFAEFVEYIKDLTAAERYLYLSDFLQTRTPQAVTPGYRALAALCAEAYFDIVLTTNLDPLLDDALADANLTRRDYLLLINSVTRPDRFSTLLTAPSPRVKVVKLHGDLFHRFMAWTPVEMDAYLEDIAPHLAPVLAGRDLLVVGNSLRDERVRQIALGTGGALWYANLTPPGPHLDGTPNLRAVIGPECTFEQIFTRLAQDLGIGAVTPDAVPPAAFPPLAPTRGLESLSDNKAGLTRSAAPAPQAPPQTPNTQRPTPRPPASTVDEMMACVVGLAEGDAPPYCTAFLLHEPRLLVADGFPAAHFKTNNVTVVTADGRRFESRILKRATGHAFAPFLVEAPQRLVARGLRLDPAPLAPGMAVRMAVAAGERVGLSSGRVEDATERSLEIAPLGLVDYLVRAEAFAAPGSSGAPVVDENFAVRGYVVAAAQDGPPCFLYPASRWHKDLVT